MPYRESSWSGVGVMCEDLQVAINAATQVIVVPTNNEYDDRYVPGRDFSGLQPDDMEQNVRVALEASATLGISQVLRAADVCGATPDRLAVCTCIIHNSSPFTGRVEIRVEDVSHTYTIFI